MLKRLPDWEKRLALYIMGRRFIPFIPGVNDDVAFAQNAILAITGSLVDSITSELPEVKVKLAKRGDSVMITLSGSQSLGIVGNDGVVSWFAGEHGLIQKKTIECEKAWKVG